MPEISDEQWQAEADAGYRAIGRHVAAFSQLIAFMRKLIARHLTEGTTHSDSHVEMLLGEVGPKNIADSFFGLCRTAGGLREDELHVASTLETRVSEANQVRTDVAHGDWSIGDLEGADATRVLPMELLRIKPARKGGAAKTVSITVDELNDHADDLWTLTMLVSDFGRLALGMPIWVFVEDEDGEDEDGEDEVRYILSPAGSESGIRVGDVYCNAGTRKERRIERAGPRADEVALMRFVGMHGRSDNQADMQAVDRILAEQIKPKPLR